MITNEFIIIVPGLKHITLLYTITPIGVGGGVLFCSKVDIGDKDFQDKLIL